MGTQFDTENSIQRKKENESTLKKNNKEGLPEQLRFGAEHLSGISMEDVKVHYNSPKPGQIQALAYTQGDNIHVAPGQERYLPHETWHVVQQKQGRVSPTMNVGGQAVNDNPDLEREADIMGSKISRSGMSENGDLSMVQRVGCVVQKAGEFTGLMPSHIIRASEKDLKDLAQSQGKVSVDLTYHHIIAENILESVVKNTIGIVCDILKDKEDKTQGEIKLMNSVEALLSTHKAFRKVVQNFKNYKDSLQRPEVEEGDIAEVNNKDYKFSEGNEDGYEETRYKACGDLGAAIRWIPGNIHQGPSYRTMLGEHNLTMKNKNVNSFSRNPQDYIGRNAEYLTEDGGNGFEYAAINVVGQQEMTDLIELFKKVLKLFSYNKKDKNGEVQTLTKQDVTEGGDNLIQDINDTIIDITALYYKYDDRNKVRHEIDSGHRLQGADAPVFNMPYFNIHNWEKIKIKKPESEEGDQNSIDDIHKPVKIYYTITNDPKISGMVIFRQLPEKMKEMYTGIIELVNEKKIDNSEAVFDKLNEIRPGLDGTRKDEIRKDAINLYEGFHHYDGSIEKQSKFAIKTDFVERFCEKFEIEPNYILEDDTEKDDPEKKQKKKNRIGAVETPKTLCFEIVNNVLEEMQDSVVKKQVKESCRQKILELSVNLENELKDIHDEGEKQSIIEKYYECITRIVLEQKSIVEEQQAQQEPEVYDETDLGTGGLFGAF